VTEGSVAEAAPQTHPKWLTQYLRSQSYALFCIGFVTFLKRFIYILCHREKTTL